MSLPHAIPDLKQHVPSILTYAPDSHSKSFIAKPSLVGIGPPNARKGDRIVQFIDCDVAAVIRSTEPSPEYTYDEDSGGTFAKGSKNYELVGRALLLKTSKEMPFKSEAESKFRWPLHSALNNVQNQFSCYLDMEVLWALTR